MKRVMKVEIESSRKPFACKLLIILHVFLGIGGIFGGAALVIDPSGELIQMPISLLEYSPFSNFLIPGIILLVMLGIAPLVVSYGLIRKTHWNPADKLNIFSEKHWAWTYSLYIGFILIFWITAQVYLIKQIALVHVGYILLGLIVQATTLLPSVQNYYFTKLK